MQKKSNTTTNLTIIFFITIVLFGITVICENIFKIESNYENGIVTFLAICFAGPVIEEVVFRYLMFYRLKKFIKTSTAIILSSMIFGALHYGDWSSMVLAFVAGVAWCVIYNKTDKLYFSVLSHAMLNTLLYFVNI